MSDLVEKLRRTAEYDCREVARDLCFDANDGRVWADLMDEAAAEITHLQKELETARESLERLVTTYDGMEDGNGDPCPDVAHAKTVIRFLKDKEVAG